MLDDFRKQFAVLEISKENFDEKWKLLLKLLLTKAFTQSLADAASSRRLGRPGKLQLINLIQHQFSGVPSATCLPCITSQ